MKYLRVIISNSLERPIYKKDFDPRNVFDTYTRELASLLIQAGTIYEGEYYGTTFTPCYLASSSAKETDAGGRVEPKEWITLRYEGDVKPETPVDYFKVEFAPLGREYVHRTVLEIDELIHFWLSIEQLLVQLALLSGGEAYTSMMYARDDDEANFEREELYPWEEDASRFVEIVPDRNSTALWSSKALGDFHLIEARQLREDKLVNIPLPDQEDSTAHLHILMTRSVLENLQQIARIDKTVEQGGVLVGNAYENAHSSGFIIEINGYIPAEETFANEIELRYSFESWQRQKTLLNERYPDNRIVGWYHTHLDLVKHKFYTGKSEYSSYTSSLFFSVDDTFTHSQFFAEKWYVAMVLNSEGNLIFFKWKDDEIVEERTFYIVGPEV